MTDRTGQRVRIILIGDRFYSGIILSDEEHLILLKDKFGNNVSIGKSSIISMEVIG
jgi:hypothetical protein